MLTPDRLPDSETQLRQLLHLALRSLAKTDVYAYGEYAFGYEPAPHHRAMVDFALDIIENKRSGIILAPRGAAKTTWLNTILLSWLIARRPDIRVGLFSQKAEKAEAMSAAIMSILSGLDEFIEVFGNLRGPWKWTAAEWLRKDSPHFKTKDRTMVTGGADQASSAVSKRFDLIVGDDLLDENNTYTIDRREKFETWFWKTLKPTQAAEGAATLIFGTRWTEDDIYQKLIEDNKWPALVIRAVEPNPVTGEDVSYWPSVWPLTRLYTEREDVGWDNFACSYLNDISGLREGTIFRREWWKDLYFEQLPKDRKFVYTMGVDLASSERERADWTTRVVVAEDEQHEHYVLQADRVKTESGHRAFVQAGYDWALSQGYAISRIVIETNQHQSTFVQDLLHETTLPAVGRRTDTDKRTRARAAAARYESHRVHHHISLRGHELETELLSFPKGHDDLIDALGLAMDLTGATGAIAAAHTPARPVGEERRPMVELGREVTFVTGSQIVPAHVAAMLDGIETQNLTLEESMSRANARRMQDFLRSAISNVIPRNG